jgi:hypothetical protein
MNGSSKASPRLLALSLAAVTLVVTACSSPKDTISQAAKSEPQKPSLEEVKAIAEEGFVYGLPLVMAYDILYMYTVDKNSGQYKAPMNVLYNEDRVFTPADTAVITPNSDTPYSLAFVDLRAEPIVVSVPAVPAPRYYSVQLTDNNTFTYGYIGSRATGTEAGDYLIVGPTWKGEKPAGVKQVFTSSSQFSAVIFRTQLFDAKDIENVKKIQAGYKLQPLSAFLKQPAPPPAPALSFPKIDKDLVKTEFFEYVDFALAFAPPGPEEKAIREKLARIGIGAGKTFEFKDLSLEHKAALLLGMREGSKKVDEAIAHFGKDVNGWRVGSPFGDRAFYNGNWMLRAAAARAGIYGNDAVEAMYPMAKVDEAGAPLDGSKASYTINFPKGQLPPVNAFWSVTMYDGKTQLLVANPLNRYLINSPMLPSLKKGKDGSLTLYVQAKSPGKDKESNWLPAPDGPIYMVMRLYWPKTEPPSILPPGEGTWQPPAVKKVGK